MTKRAPAAATATAEVAPESRKRASSPGRGSKPGERRGGRQPGTPNKVTKDIREAIRELLESCAPRMGGWLERVAADDPAKAIDLALKAAEYAIPRLSRVSSNVNGDLRVHGMDLAEAIAAARQRADTFRRDATAGTEGEMRAAIERAFPPMFQVVTGVPDPKPMHDPEAYAAECERFHKSQAREEAYPPGHPEPLPRAPAATEAPGAAWKPRRIEIPDEYVGGAQYNPLESK